MIDACRRLAAAIAPETGAVPILDEALSGALGTFTPRENTIRLDLSAIAADYPEHVEAAAIGIAIHELAHATAPAGELLAPAGANPCQMDAAHSLPFIRRAAHLFVRSCLAGYSPLDAAVFDFWPITLQRYLTLPGLIRETFCMLGDKFDDIERTAAPADLVHQFETDRRKFGFRFEAPNNA